jgi:hypothetical protein
MSQFPAKDHEDKEIRQMFVQSFNRESAAVASELARTKKEVRNASKKQTPDSHLADAEQFASITEEQNKTATELAFATTFALLRSIDVSDHTAKTTEYLALSCDEYTELLKQNESVAHAQTSAYSQSAGLIQLTLEKHRCRK